MVSIGRGFVVRPKTNTINFARSKDIVHLLRGLLYMLFELLGTLDLDRFFTREFKDDVRLSQNRQNKLLLLFMINSLTKWSKGQPKAFWRLEQLQSSFLLFLQRLAFSSISADVSEGRATNWPSANTEQQL